MAGEIDAFFSVRVRDARTAPEARRLRPLLADAQATEAAYYTATGLYPLLHVVIVSSALVERDPEAPRRLYDAYAEAKRAALARKLGATLLPWGDVVWERTLARFGGDPLPYGMSPLNRRNLDALGRHLHDQHLVRALPSVEALFAPGSLDWPPA